MNGSSHDCLGGRTPQPHTPRPATAVGLVSRWHPLDGTICDQAQGRSLLSWSIPADNSPSGGTWTEDPGGLEPSPTLTPHGFSQCFYLANIFITVIITIVDTDIWTSGDYTFTLTRTANAGLEAGLGWGWLRGRSWGVRTGVREGAHEEAPGRGAVEQGWLLVHGCLLLSAEAGRDG